MIAKFKGMPRTYWLIMMVATVGIRLLGFAISLSFNFSPVIGILVSIVVLWAFEIRSLGNG